MILFGSRLTNNIQMLDRDFAMICKIKEIKINSIYHTQNFKENWGTVATVPTPSAPNSRN
jgi:hypothetical protein